MIYVKRLTRDRLNDISRIHPRENIDPPDAQVRKAMLEVPYAWVAYDSDGTPVAAFGAFNMADPDFYRCWAFLDRDASKRSVYDMHNWIVRFLRRAEFRRLEITVVDGFDDGLVWPARLGFELEGKMSKYDVQGNDYYLLAMVK